MSQDIVLAKIDTAKTYLAKASNLQEVHKVIAMADAASVYAKRIHASRETCNLAAEIKLRAERRLGELWKQTPKNSGSKRNSGGSKMDPPDKRPTLRDHGLDKHAADRARTLAAAPEDDFEAEISKGKRRDLVPNRVIKTLKRQLHSQEAVAAEAKACEEITVQAAQSFTDVCDIRACTCAELFRSGIKPDAVVTDPPYPKEFLPVYSELAEAAANVPLVAVMVGQSYLPEVLRRLCEHLRYRWTLAYLTPGGQAVQQWPVKVNTFWKPVLLFGKSAEWFGDVVSGKVNDNDKRFHKWGQSESGMADLVERLTLPGHLVCDPFVGGGTTAVVSVALNRRFVGCDVDAKAVKETEARIKAL